MFDAAQRPLARAGIVLGMGMGGFVDGIVFHQVLQLHAMLSAIRPQNSLVNVEVNMFWDGIFHVATWVMTAAGIALLWRAVRSPRAVLETRVLIGAMALGWGLFNVVEGTVDHYLLELHHVVERLGLSVFDHAFLLSGVVLCALGVTLLRPTSLGASTTQVSNTGNR